jgi:hypothetical protein
MTIEEAILKEVQRELIGASEKFENFHNAHEGYAVIREEVDELWDEIKSKTGTRRNCYNEAIQVAAMAVRFCRDLYADQVPSQGEAG